MTALDEVTARRREQIAKGYDSAHDDEHVNGCIALAAAAYAGRAFWKNQPPPLYPWGKMPDGTRREDLIDAAALCIAEIERMDRACHEREEKLTEALVAASRSLAGAISLLEHTPEAKKAAASDKMFDQMIADYKRSLEKARAALP